MSEDWEGGIRQGIRWARVLAVLALTAAAAMWWTQRDGGLQVEIDAQPGIGGPTELAEVVVTGPLRAGDRWYCPDDFPIRVYDDGRYYPQHYPRSGRDMTRPHACFADEERARADGYQVAPPPPGASLAGGVYVVQSAAPGRLACARLAADVGFAVPCPTRLPSPASGPSCAEGRCRFDDGIVIEQRTFDAPAQFCPGCDRHVVITGARPHQSPHLVTCPDPQGVPEDGGSVTPVPPDDLAAVGPHVTIQTCGQGPPWIPGIGGIPHEGHTVGRWRSGGVVYAVSVEGHEPQQRQLLEVIVEGLERCEPGPGQPVRCRRWHG